MGHITVGTENSTSIELHHEDQGAGRPVVLIHGYPLDGSSWERPTRELLAHGSWSVAIASAPVAAHAVVASWIEDFRADVEAVRDSGRPALILHGTADNILPIDATARRFRQMLPGARYVEIEGAPDGLLWTHAAEVNAALRAFLGTARDAATPTGPERSTAGSAPDPAGAGQGAPTR